MIKNRFFKKKTEPEKPPERTPEEIKAEYEKVCGFAGEEQFKIKAAEARLGQLNQRLVQLHNEFSQAEAKKAAADAAAATAVKNDT